MDVIRKSAELAVRVPLGNQQRQRDSRMSSLVRDLQQQPNVTTGATQARPIALLLTRSGRGRGRDNVRHHQYGSLAPRHTTGKRCGTQRGRSTVDAGEHNG
jgi:hypothetical protein